MVTVPVDPLMKAVLVVVETSRPLDAMVIDPPEPMFKAPEVRLTVPRMLKAALRVALLGLTVVEVPDATTRVPDPLTLPPLQALDAFAHVNVLPDAIERFAKLLLKLTLATAVT